MAMAYKMVRIRHLISVFRRRIQGHRNRMDFQCFRVCGGARRRLRA
jgi:hypothetical protein